MQGKQWTFKAFFIRILKITGWIIGSIVVLLLVLALVIQIPAVQRRIVQKAVSYAEKKIGTRVTLGGIGVSFPKEVVIKDLYVEDQAQDTLIYLKELDISTDLWELLHHKIQLNKVTIENLRSHFTRKAAESDFNFSYIIRKFSDTTSVTEIDTTAKPWQFSLKKIIIRRSNINVNDAHGGIQSDLSLGLIAVDLDVFDLDSSVIKANTIELSGIKGYYTESKLSPPDTSAGGGLNYDLGFRKIALSNINVKYLQEVAGQSLQLKIKTGGLIANRIDLKQRVIELKTLSLDSSLFAYQQMAVPAIVTTPTTKTGQPWQIKLAKLALSGNTLQFYDFRSPVKHGQADFSHLWISNLTLDADRILIDNDHYSANITELTLVEKNGLMIRKGEGEIELTAHSAIMKNFKLQTNRSNIAINGRMGFESLGTLGSQYARASINLNVSTTSVELSDILYFNPSLLKDLPVHINPAEIVKINTQISGSVGDLLISSLVLSTLTQTSVELSGTIKGLPDFQHAAMNLELTRFYTTRQDVTTTVPDSLLPKSISLPGWISLKGSVKGTVRIPDFNFDLSSDYGNISATGKINLDTAQQGNYHVAVDVQDLQVGNLLRDTTLGNVTMAAKVNGTGFNLKTLSTDATIDVAEFGYHGYQYHNFNLVGKMDQYLFTGNAAFKDKNLDFTIKGELDYGKDIPSYDLTFALNNADFKALNLSHRALKARGTLSVKLATTDFKIINGNIAIRKVGIFNGTTLYTVDSLLFASIDTKGQTDIKINSDIIDGSFQGTIHLLSLPEVLGRHFNSYFSLQDTAYSKPVDQQNFKFNLVIKKNELITEILLPQLRSFESSPITGQFNSAERQLDINMSVKRLHFAGMRAQSIAFNINSGKKSLDYALNIDGLRYDSLQIPGLKFTGKVAQDSIKTHLTVLDSVQKDKYQIGAVFNSLKNEFQFRLLPGELMLNYEKWNVPEDNFIRFNNTGVEARNFSIGLDQQNIGLETRATKDSTLLIVFKQLDLTNIFNIVSGSTSIVEGKLDGRFRLFVKRNNAFNSVLKISDLHIMKRPWGDLSLSATQLNTDKFELELISSGEHSDIKVKGTYIATKPASSMDVDAVINRLDLMLIEPFTSGQISKGTGYLKGQVTMRGTLTAPSIKGEFSFQDASFTSTYVNSSFTLKNETLKFNESGLTLNNFKVLDDNNNSATFKGSILTKNFKDFTLDLSLTTKNFKVLNTTAANNSLYYGKVKMNATARVTGSFDLPVVDLRMGFSDDSEFTYVVPSSSKGVLEQKGIITFVDKHPSKDPFLSSLHLQDTAQNIIKGFDLTANVTLTSSEKFNIVIDPKSGDKLMVQGSTNLIVKIDPSGNMNLSGQYEITKGSYSFSFYKLVKRDFEIVKGGTILWSGDPMDATLNLQALYKVENISTRADDESVCRPDDI